MVLQPNFTRNKYKLYSSVIPVAGYKKGILCDLNRNRIYQLPKDIIEILNSHSVIDLDYLLQIYGKENRCVLKQYLSFLLDRKLAFVTSKYTYDNFPAFNLEWDMPSTITNAQIVIKKKTCFGDLFNALSELNDLGCKAIVFIIINMSLDDNIDFLRQVDEEFGFIFDILLNYTHNKDKNKLIAYINSLKKVVNVKICDSEFDTIEKSNKYNHLTFSWLKMPIKHMPCSEIKSYSFNPRMEFFCEAKSFNSCLNRKICIDSDGKVRNCFAMPKTFGNVMHESLCDIIRRTNLSEAWYINKDKIETCKDCEYRYVCQDCRAFIKNKEDPFSKPKKCKYNPYTGEWDNK